MVWHCLWCSRLGGVCGSFRRMWTRCPRAPGSCSIIRRYGPSRYTSWSSGGSTGSSRSPALCGTVSDLPHLGTFFFSFSLAWSWTEVSTPGCLAGTLTKVCELLHCWRSATRDWILFSLPTALVLHLAVRYGCTRQLSHCVLYFHDTYNCFIKRPCPSHFPTSIAFCCAAPPRPVEVSQVACRNNFWRNSTFYKVPQ